MPLRCVFLLLTALCVSRAWADDTVPPPSPRVAIFQEPSWSPHDSARQGAAELDLLMRLVDLQKSPTPVGIVGVGNRYGVFQEGVHRALELAVGEGIPVVRLAQNGVPAPGGAACLFIDGGNRSVADAELLLKRCLLKFGPLPRLDSLAEDLTCPTFRSQMARFQAEFDRVPAPMAIASTRAD